MAPRLHSVRERRPHDFGFLVPLASGKKTPLFVPDLCERPSGFCVTSSGLNGDATLVVLDVAIDRQDVALDLVVGDKMPYTLCGPWMRGLLCDYIDICKDMIQEGRKQEAQELAKDITTLRAGLLRPLVVPVRMLFQANAYLLPGAAEGRVAIHLRTLITVDIQ